MARTVSWLFAAGVATALSAMAFSASLAWQHRALAACEAEGASAWCGMGSSVVHTILLFAGIGFLLVAALFFLAAQNAHATRVRAPNG